MTQEEQVTDPTRDNTFVCTPQEELTEDMVYQWEIIDILKGSKVLLGNLIQDQNKLIVK